MSLPKIELPVYNVKIPSSGREISIRPFKVKEEKLLLIAAESKDEQDIINATKQVLRNCILDEDVEIEKLPFFDIDYLFIALRAKSIGEAIEMKFTCNNVVENNDRCRNVFYADIDIAKATLKQDENVTKDIKLNNKLSVKMKYPTYTVMKMIQDTDDTLERKIKVLINCIDFIIDGDKVLSSKDFSKDELREFIENLSSEQFEKISYFVDNFPTFSVDFDATCPKCNFLHHIEYRNFNDFF